jgi:hypothetical protein
MASLTRRRLAAAAAALVCMGVVTYLSSLSQPDLPDGPWSWSDKVTHGAVYAVIGALWALAMPRPGRAAALTALAIAVGFGITDELHQSLVPGRDASVLDLVADAVGGAIGAFAATWYSLRRCPAPSSSASAGSDPASPPTSTSPITSR